MPSASSPICPHGVVNLHAVSESMVLLQRSSQPLHKQLYTWLKANYFEAILPLNNNNNNNKSEHKAEPIGRRIRSSSDLSILVCAYGNARALKQKEFKRGMEAELYFWGMVPGREGAVEAGLMVGSGGGLKVER